MTLSRSEVQLLADLAEHGIDVEPFGGVLRYRPRRAMTPALLDRLQAHKAELLRLLDAEAVVAELRQSIGRLWKDPVWRSGWERRFQAARYAEFASLRRVLDLILEQAEGHHRRRDWSRFTSACAYLHRLASGEVWDIAEPVADASAWEIGIDT